MDTLLRREIESSLDNCSSNEVRKEYKKRLDEGNLIRDDNIHSHFCAYFVPYNSNNKTILVGDHIKSGKWLMPGGHIDKGESLLGTINREIHEELGVKDFFVERPLPFLLSITPIEHDTRPCRKHYDIWHLMDTDGSDFNIDYTEYKETRWTTIPVARELITDPANILALDVIERI
jgi:8-oxo-dGTP pyrophosphatase MutT (NUDIX family)